MGVRARHPAENTGQSDTVMEPAGRGHSKSEQQDFLMSSSKRQFVADHVAGIPRSGIRDFFDIVQQMPDAISLGVGEPDFVTPWHIREAAIYALERGRTQYTANLGLLRLRESIARYVERKFQIGRAHV